MYRVTKRRREQMAAMRKAKESKRIAGSAPDCPQELLDLRRRIVITDYDFGERVHTLNLYRTNRVDCYRVAVDGKPWKDRIGWSRILAGLRRSMPRVISPADLC